MDRWDIVQIVLQFIFDNEDEGTDTDKILAYVQSEHDSSADISTIRQAVERLRQSEYINGTFSWSGDAMHLRPTDKGAGLILSGQTIKQALSQPYIQSEPSVSNTFSIANNYGNAAQGDGNTLSQSGLNAEALVELLNIMRSYGDDDTADKLERLERSGDQAGFWWTLLDRFSGKAVDSAADRMVSSDYAAAVLPQLAALVSGALGISGS